MKKIETALLRSDELEYRPFRIEVDGGEVSLSGYIGSDREKEAALRVAAGVSGVKKVVEDLHVVNYKAYKDKC
jgi:osmotically-inducible protein OsmY